MKHVEYLTGSKSCLAHAGSFSCSAIEKQAMIWLCPMSIVHAQVRGMTSYKMPWQLAESSNDCSAAKDGCCLPMTG